MAKKVPRRVVWIGEDLKRFVESKKLCPSETFDHALRRELKLSGLN